MLERISEYERVILFLIKQVLEQMVLSSYKKKTNKKKKKRELTEELVCFVTDTLCLLALH